MELMSSPSRKSSLDEPFMRLDCSASWFSPPNLAVDFLLLVGLSALSRSPSECLRFLSDMDVSLEFFIDRLSMEPALGFTNNSVLISISPRSFSAFFECSALSGLPFSLYHLCCRAKHLEFHSFIQFAHL